jgi:hypothetical protein
MMFSKNFNINASEFTMKPMLHSVIILCGPDFGDNKAQPQDSSVSFCREISLCSMTGLDDNGRRIEVERIAEKEIRTVNENPLVIRPNG